MSKSALRAAVVAAAIGLFAQPASACESGTVTYSATGTYRGISYTAVRVFWEYNLIWLKQPNGTWVDAWSMTPAFQDQRLFDSIVSDLIQREVSSDC